MGDRRIIRGTWLDFFICSECREPREGRAAVVAGELAVCHGCLTDVLVDIELAAPADASA